MNHKFVVPFGFVNLVFVNSKRNYGFVWLACSVVGRTLPFRQLVLPNWQLPGRLQRPWAEGGRTEAVYCSTRVPDKFSLLFLV